MQLFETLEIVSTDINLYFHHVITDQTRFYVNARLTLSTLSKNYRSHMTILMTAPKICFRITLVTTLPEALFHCCQKLKKKGKINVVTSHVPWLMTRDETVAC